MTQRNDGEIYECGWRMLQCSFLQNNLVFLTSASSG